MRVAVSGAELCGVPFSPAPLDKHAYTLVLDSAEFDLAWKLPLQFECALAVCPCTNLPSNTLVLDTDEFALA